MTGSSFPHALGMTQDNAQSAEHSSQRRVHQGGAAVPGTSCGEHHHSGHVQPVDERATPWREQLGCGEGKGSLGEVAHAQNPGEQAGTRSGGTTFRGAGQASRKNGQGCPDAGPQQRSAPDWRVHGALLRTTVIYRTTVSRG